VGHTGIVTVQRRGNDDAGAARAAGLVALDAVHGVWTLRSANRPDVSLDIVFVEGDSAVIAQMLRDAAPMPSGVEVIVDTPWERITPLHYPWADAIRASELPRTVND
jgi:hypothetical protein